MMKNNILFLIFLVFISCQTSNENNRINLKFSDFREIIVDTLNKEIIETLKGEYPNSIDTTLMFHYEKMFSEDLSEVEFEDFISKYCSLRSVEYYKNGILFQDFEYDSLKSEGGKKVYGTISEYYKNGNKKTSGRLYNNKYHGRYKTFYEDGNLKSDNLFLNNYKVYWINFDSLGKIGEESFKVAFDVDKRVNTVGNATKIKIFHPLPERFSYHHYKIGATVVPISFSDESSKEIETVKIHFEEITTDSIKGIGEISYTANEIGSYVILGDLVMFSSPDSISERLRFMYDDGSNQIEFITSATAGTPPAENKN